MSNVQLEQLPKVDEFLGLYSDGPEPNSFLLRYRSGDKFYEIAIPFDQTFIMEELFIRLRQYLGAIIAASRL